MTCRQALTKGLGALLCKHFGCKATLLLGEHWPKGSTGRRPVRKKRPTKWVYFFWFWIFGHPHNNIHRLSCFLMVELVLIPKFLISEKFHFSQWLCTPPKTIVSSTEKNSIRRMQIHTFRTESLEGMVTMQTIYIHFFLYNADWENNMGTLCSSQHLQRHSSIL